MIEIVRASAASPAESYRSIQAQPWWLLLDRPALHFDLQRFAAEDEGRTELPSDRRKREEREKGNVPKSQDLASAIVLIGTVVTLFLGGTLILRQIMQVFERYLSYDFMSMTRFEFTDLRQLAMDLFFQTGKIVAPIMIAAVIMAIVGNVSQFGLFFAPRALEFKPERLIPDFKRVLPVRRNLFALGKIIIQVVIIATAAYILIVDDYIPMLKSANMELNQAIPLFAWVAFKLLIVTAIILTVLAIPDFFYQRFEYMENLKVTVSESRRERRDEEGDPMIRQRQRERAYDLRRQRNMLQEVPRADVVVTNPTHFAVALQYDPGNTHAPVVTAKGADHLAYLIRTIARENNVPVEENPRLARTLYDEVEVGQEIPETLYRVVSMLFARLNRFRKAGAAAGR
ncbi:MAG: EscU/YscU/HrcU family type III secretion system export apparatus switch protein [Leptospiraceae bacterium]|nr:EscU/YscU/HrcU family type III secretion system export apparatus switch protein [Leptospiraceae bacterium]MCP5486799.1 EscU/YscU/HrcU family type III secretion system export apparatus switch protein [Spirochaetales bacterium]